MNIVFVTGSVKEFRFLKLVSGKLQEKGTNSFFISTRKYIFDYSRKKGCQQVLFVPAKVKEITEEEISYYLKKYKYFNLSLIKFSDPILKKVSNHDAIKTVVFYLKFWEEFLHQNRISAVIHYPTANVIGRTAYVVCKKNKYNIKHWTIQTGPNVDENFTICDINEDWVWSEFLNGYRSDKFSLSSQLKNIIEDKVSKVIQVKNRSLKIRKITARILTSFLFHTIKYKKLDRIEINEFKKLLGPFARRLPLIFFRYDHIDRKDKFLFFPLHISWDAQIATRNPMLANQLYLVEILSRSLPYGYYLYVKEHPYNYGGEKIGMLKEIKRYRNVKLVHPEMSSTELIKHSEAVITINSTAGWETLLLKKPLITFGNTFYSFFKYTFSVKEFSDIPRIIQECLFKDWEEVVKSQNYIYEWYKFLWGVFSTAKSGAAVSYKNYMGLGAQVADYNVNTVAKSFDEKLNDSNN
jgi:capsule polysaccharide modification protein KpsS